MTSTVVTRTVEASLVGTRGPTVVSVSTLVSHVVCGHPVPGGERSTASGAMSSVPYATNNVPPGTSKYYRKEANYTVE